MPESFCLPSFVSVSGILCGGGGRAKGKGKRRIIQVVPRLAEAHTLLCSRFLGWDGGGSTL